MTLFEKKFGKDFLKGVALKPGTYIFSNADGKILYIGRAKNLRRRLSQYKNTKRLRKHRKMRAIVERATRLEWSECETHLDACVREVKLIQEHRPRFNIDAKYSFMYPLIGVQIHAQEIYLCLTTHPEKFPGFQFFGAYRSRRVTGAAFFSVYHLLKFVYHPVSPAKLRKFGIVQHSYVLGLRKVAETEVQGLLKFLRGENAEFLGEMTLRLLEKKAARAKKESVQEYLDALTKFFRWEARQLRTVMERQGLSAFPISQLERDLVFLRARIKG